MPLRWCFSPHCGQWIVEDEKYPVPSRLLRNDGLAAYPLLVDPPLLVIGETGTRGDEAADDDVLLQAIEPVQRTPHGGLCEHTGRLLEGGG